MKILFVCMGNICRSPTAEGVMRQQLENAGLAHRVTVDSAGTHNYHPGKAPDARSQHHAAQRGYDLSPLCARQITDEDFEHFDLILTMDWDNQSLTEAICPPAHLKKVRRLAEFFQSIQTPWCPTRITAKRLSSSACWTWWRTGGGAGGALPGAVGRLNGCINLAIHVMKLHNCKDV